MNKAINITSLIGIILQSFSSLLFLVFLVLSITGAMDANFTTTVNGETTVHSAEAAQHVFNVGFLVIFIVAIFSLIFGIIGMMKKKTNTIASGVFYIIGAISSLNMITFIYWLVCGVLLIKKRQNKSINDNKKHLVD
ncbi:DUF4064 domain-containing protein [Staphylococcus epidermidis]|uniref:DUF4064 domain-containing protein n=1 Tax=Staphylococcus epidermidis TaxID=1282 RepID=UPI002DB79028|nr:DUF4064 domain-containing protein [Staphylococcus epidermidis]MCG2351607.1 DUF4064 domain-containing protein [Staphylococcus epidermidis]MEB6269167.1 DUF4064 domain-containing protein [Staphylococcus epidermidis]